jgi:phosphoribosylaminoimidazolecarboxamide formyltransferase/IMP cyclohydrolase
MNRALISVWNKEGVEQFARSLWEAGVQIISSGGTARFLSKASIPVIPVEDVTGFPEMLDGRVKTLHPKIHGAILARRANPSDMETVKVHGIVPIDVVAVNLYPFVRMLEDGVVGDDLLEYIDIGGPTLLRAAAKNYKDVLVVCDPADYDEVARHVAAGGNVDMKLRQRLATKVFDVISDYDRSIASWLASAQPS